MIFLQFSDKIYDISILISNLNKILNQITLVYNIQLSINN